MCDAMEGSNRRVSLFEIMSEMDSGKNSLAEFPLDAVLNPIPTQHCQLQQPTPQPSRSKTLLDIIKDEEQNKDRRTWKQFREKLRLKRAGAAWISTVQIPASDILIGGNNRFHSSPPHTLLPDASASSSDNFTLHVPISDPSLNSSRSQFTRLSSVRNGHNTLDTDGSDQPVSARLGEGGGRLLLGEALAEERRLSEREAVAAQEAAEVAAVTAGRERENEAAIGEGDRPLSMSLMDLMGGCGDEDEENEEVEDDDGVTAMVAEETDGGIEHTCCVCMVRHKGAAFIPCGHTFCRSCSRELLVQRGACPICNNFIVEILDLF